MNVAVRNLQDRPTTSPQRLESVASTVQGRVESTPGTVGVVFVDDAAMKHYHERFLQRSTTTDVLSFGDPESLEPDYWGDVVICTDQAARQARELDLPYDAELLILALHGFLHLLGYDHVVDSGVMHRLEEELRPRCLRPGPG